MLSNVIWMGKIIFGISLLLSCVELLPFLVFSIFFVDFWFTGVPTSTSFLNIVDKKAMYVASWDYAVLS